MKLVLRLVKSFSGPPDTGSRYDGPGPTSPNQAASAWGGITRKLGRSPVLQDGFNYVFYYPNLSTETHAVIVFNAIIEV